MKVISLESIRGVIRSPATYGTTLAFIGAMGIFTYVANHDKALRVKEDGDNYISIQLSAFAPPSKDKIADIVQKPKPKKHHHKKKKKKHHDDIQAPPKPMPSPLQAKQEITEEKPQEEIKQEDIAINTPPQEDTQAPEAKEATTTKSDPDANADRNIKMLRFSDGIDDPFLKAVREAIEKRNEYPQLARSRGYEDIVFLRFIVNLDGSISNEEVYKESKYSVLNKAALKALRKASRNFPKPSEVTYIEIPLEYRLNRI